jgi:hypothetical protein
MLRSVAPRRTDTGPAGDSHTTHGDDASPLRGARPQPQGPLLRRLGLGLELVGHEVLGQPRPRVGRYEIAGKLGLGAMGTVFRAFDPALARPLALKVLHEPAHVAVLLQEARTLAALAHPHVLVVHDVGDEAGQVWIATELVDGGTWREWAADQPRLRWRAVIERAIEAGQGLAAAHRAGVVHRDVKPDNVLIGSDGRVRVADFGLAVTPLSDTSSAAAASPATAAAPPHPPGSPSADPRAASPAAREWAGTPRYMAPEVRRGEPATPRADQFGFAKSVEELLDRAVDRAAVPAPLTAALARALAPDPAQRWSSMAALVERLAEAVVDAGASDPATAAAGPGEPAPAGWSSPSQLWLPSQPPALRGLVAATRDADDRGAFRRAALAWLDAHVGFDTVLLGRPELDGPAGPLVQNFEPAFVAQFRSDPARYAPALGMLMAASAHELAPVRDVDVFSLAERARLPFYTELIGRKGSRVMVVGALAHRGTLAGSLQLSRAGLGARFTAAELRCVRLALAWFAEGELRWAAQG